jgi:hypothetical protein
MADMNNTMVVIRANGSRGSISPTWDAAKAALGGAMIEVVYLRGGAVLLVDEEGLLKSLDLNIVATNIAGHEIVGDAVMVPKELVTAVLD